MYVVESKGGAIACMLLALTFLGTWPALLTLLERRGRLPQHTYLDYTITNLLAAVIIAFTFGEIGQNTIEKPNFLNQLSQVNQPCLLFTPFFSSIWLLSCKIFWIDWKSMTRSVACWAYTSWISDDFFYRLMQDNWPSVLFAMGGGIVLSLGNLATQYAWAFVGLSVTEVITSSITVVIGTLYLIQRYVWSFCVFKVALYLYRSFTCCLTNIPIQEQRWITS